MRSVIFKMNHDIVFQDILFRVIGSNGILLYSWIEYALHEYINFGLYQTVVSKHIRKS